MTGLLCGVAMLVSSAGVSPATERPHAIATPPSVFNIEIPHDEQERWLSRSPSLFAVQPATAKRHTKVDRFIALAAGATVGFVVGGTIGGKITDRSKTNPDDDVSVLKGVIIGAPIGAVAGAIIGWRLTRN